MTDIILISKIDIVSPLEEEPDLIEIPVLGGLEKLHFEISHPTKINPTQQQRSFRSIQHENILKLTRRHLFISNEFELISPLTAINEIHS
jgi:hypothetical protein